MVSTEITIMRVLERGPKKQDSPSRDSKHPSRSLVPKSQRINLPAFGRNQPSGEPPPTLDVTRSAHHSLFRSDIHYSVHTILLLRDDL